MNINASPSVSMSFILRCCTRLLMLVLLGLVASGIANAQRTYLQSPPTVTTATKLAFTIDLNGDTGADLVIVDRATGSYRIGQLNANQEFNWGNVQDTGMTNIESGAAGHFLLTNAWSLMLSSKSFNRAQPIPLDGSDLPVSMGFTYPEPQTLCSFEPVSGGVTRLFVGFANGGAMPGFAPPVGCYSAFGFVPQQWLNDANADPHDAAPIYGLASAQPTVGYLATAQDGTHSELTVVKEGHESGPFGSYSYGTSIGSMTALPLNAKFTSGNFSFDVGPIDFGFPSTTLLVWSPTDALLRTARVTNVDWVNNTLLQDGMSLLSNPTFNMSRLIKSVHVIESGTVTQLLIVWGDVAGGASLFSFDGVTAPTLIENVDMNGLDLEAVMPSANGSTVFLGMRNGQFSWDRYQWDGTHFSRTRTGTIPGAPVLPLYSNVVAFQGEPFVDPAAIQLSRKRTGDWTVLASLIAGTANVTSLVDGGASVGLGNASVSQLTFPGSSTNLLLSKMDGASSIAFLGNSTSATSNLSHVTFAPAPGTYQRGRDDPPLTITMSATNTSFEATPIKYSINNQEWQTYQADAPPTISLTSTIKAYVSKSPFLGGNGPITSGAYTMVGLFPAIEKQPIVDANSNGLSDAWENLTGVTNPAADDDGDGFLNLQEQNAGTDPHNALDKPGAISGALGLGLLRDTVPSASPNILRWSALDAAVVLEGSDDLVNWFIVTNGIYQVNDENRFNMPTGLMSRRFYRLRR